MRGWGRNGLGVDIVLWHGFTAVETPRWLVLYRGNQDPNRALLFSGISERHTLASSYRWRVVIIEQGDAVQENISRSVIHICMQL